MLPNDHRDIADRWCSTYVTIRDLKGDWKKDPRYDDAYYFIRVEEEEEKD